MLKYLYAFLVLSGLAACGPTQQEQEAAQAETPPVAEAEWEVLFDGESLNGWHLFLKEGTEGWAARDGELVSTGGGHGDLITDETFDNFELSLEFKLGAEGNSGIFYLVIEDSLYKSILTGPEYQLIDDDGYPAELEAGQVTGASYDMYAPMLDADLPPGTYNEARILVENGHVEHWLNGQKVVEYELGSEDWMQRKSISKWADSEGYGKARKGHIGLQDHGDGETAFRNIKIRRL